MILAALTECHWNLLNRRRIVRSMEIKGNTLSFTPKEIDVLTTVLSNYGILAPTDTPTAAKDIELADAVCRDGVGFIIHQRIYQAASEDGEEPKSVEFLLDQEKRIQKEQYNRTCVLVADGENIVAPNTEGALGRVILWAAEQFYPGSPIIDARREIVMTANIADRAGKSPEKQAEGHEWDLKLADTREREILEAMPVVKEWAEQLRQPATA